MSRSRNSRLVAVIGLVLLAVVAGRAAAAKKPTLPINIEADHAQFSKDTGKSIYTGSVRLTRAGLTLTGDKLVLSNVQQQGQLHAVLTGSPAHVDKQPDQDGKDVVTGHSRRIILDKPSHLVTMQGDAVLNRGGDHVTGEQIIHNMQTDRTRAERGGDSHKRVKVTLHPKKNKDGS